MGIKKMKRNFILSVLLFLFSCALFAQSNNKWLYCVTNTTNDSKYYVDKYRIEKNKDLYIAWIKIVPADEAFYYISKMAFDEEGGRYVVATTSMYNKYTDKFIYSNDEVSGPYDLIPGSVAEYILLFIKEKLRNGR